MTVQSTDAMAKRTYLKNALERGEAGVGMWLTMPGSQLATTIATIPGFNWILIDAEHGAITDADYYPVCDLGLTQPNPSSTRSSPPTASRRLSASRPTSRG